jgi:hypothetical protein
MDGIWPKFNNADEEGSETLNREAFQQNIAGIRYCS